MLTPMEQFNLLILRTHAYSRLLSKQFGCALKIMQIAIAAMAAALNSTARADVVEPGQFGAPLFEHVQWVLQQIRPVSQAILKRITTVEIQINGMSPNYAQTTEA